MVLLFRIVVLMSIVFNSSLIFAVERLDLNESKVCSYYGEKIIDAVYSFRSDQNTESIIERIVRYSGLQQNFVIKAGNVPNATASIIDKKRIVVYNQSFLRDVVERAGTPWAATAILAHEIGHHLNNHTLAGGGSRPDRELEADEFSGHTLYRMGATLKETKSALELDTNLRGSRTHPPTSARLAAITSGWISAQEQDPSATKRKQQESERVKQLQRQLQQEKEEAKEREDKYKKKLEAMESDEFIDEIMPKEVGNFCCDLYTGIRVCQMDPRMRLAVGDSCSCYFFGLPATIGQVCN